ncbi:MAG: LysM peptidoglycan-binding domain-containing M23 family metallopeptidase [Alphaproteobacteria bacterium]|nr:LysM peptidoglycan-binding domain-containing M23 family metallopeptidase [Alphaproteobacteria bacterium]
MVLYGQTPGEGSGGVHTVSRGETISSIARRYDIVMRDIVVGNALSAPFVLQPGQRIKLPPPRAYKARAGDTVYSVSRLFEVSSTELATLNRLSPPYALKVGQTLKLPSLDAQNLAGAAPVPPVRAENLAGRNSSAVPPPGRKPIYRFAGAMPPSSAVVPDNRGGEADAPRQSSEKHQASAAKAKIVARTPPRASSKFMQPVSGRVVSGYGSKADGLHNDGINIAAPRGTQVQAAENGVVVYAGSELKGSGNLVLIRHDGRWMTAYAHMDSIKVKRGDTVKRGQQIGAVGSTGSVDTPQLHFEIRRGTEAINPERYLES